jgi:tetratricopeptide (TPR) repeat protein
MDTTILLNSNAGWALWWASLAVTVLLVVWRHGGGARGGRGGLESPAWAAVILALSLLFWVALGQHTGTPAVEFAAMSLAAFSLGSVLGFVFSSYEEEASSIGRVREWLLGGLGTLALADTFAGTGKVLLAISAFTPRTSLACPQELSTSVFVTYFVVGFFSLFVLRKLEWNLKFTGGDCLRQVETALRDFDMLKALQIEGKPPELSDRQKQAFDEFIRVTEDAIRKQALLPKEVPPKLARAYLYLGRFKEAAELLEGEMALSPSRDAAVKLAQALIGLKKPIQAGAVLLHYNGVDPNSTRVWRSLGYVLLWDEAKLDEAIAFGQKYGARYPGDGGALLNIACAFGQKYALARRRRRLNPDAEASQVPTSDEASFRESALGYLDQAIDADPSMRDVARNLVAEGDDFASLKDDVDFQKLVGPSKSA